MTDKKIKEVQLHMLKYIYNKIRFYLDVTYNNVLHQIPPSLPVLVVSIEPKSRTILDSLSFKQENRCS